MAKLEEVNTALEAREKILREDTVKVEFMQQKLLIRENKVILESKRLENWSQEIKTGAGELEKQKQFINEERDYLDKQKTDLEGKRN